MKQIIVSYILLLFFVSVIVQPVLPLLDYAVNYKHISEDLCENKDKPEMHCNGKCHLKKEIKKAMDNESNPAQKKIVLNNKIKEYINYYRIHLIRIPHKKYRFKTCQSVYITQKSLKGFAGEMLKPPQCSG